MLCSRVKKKKMARKMKGNTLLKKKIKEKEEKGKGKESS